MEEKYINELYKLTKKALKQNEVPVAAVIIKNNKIIAKAINRKNKSNNPLDHAEIIAIKKAAKKIKNWRLNDCKMYVTLEPCDMCKTIIKECRMGEVAYILTSNNKKTKNSVEYTKCKINTECFQSILVNFFKEKR